MIALAVVTALLAATSRVAMASLAAAGARVDHYYWMVAAQAYREQRGLPVRIRGKYLLEDERQGYPPLFGLLLGRCGLDRWGSGTALVLEIVQMVILAWVLAYLRAPIATIALALALYAAAPVLVTYNLQLNSRMLGDIFLFSLLMAEVAATTTGGLTGVALWGVAAVLTSLVLMTHKMTLQLYAVLLLPWAWALGTFLPIAAFIVGGAIYVLVVGGRFAAYQFSMHWELVQFWNRHWRLMGAHQFRHSPVYGDEQANCSSCFHRPGPAGALKHLRVAASYAPAAMLMPLASAASGAWPPAWLMVWLGVVYAWALATLLVPRLKCLGGGHLYVFNAVAPAALWLAWLPAAGVTRFVVGCGIALTAVSLAIAWRIVGSRPAPRDHGFFDAVSMLRGQRPGRVAVFPLQGAEAVAWETPHAVLWGGHGSGLSLMEGFFPVLRQPLATFLRRHDVGWVLCDDRYWRLGAADLQREGLEARGERLFGTWRLTELVPQAART